MRSAIIHPGPLSGCVTPPPSKSSLHRIIICASLARGKSTITPFAPSDDIMATIGAMKTLGALIEIHGNILTIDGSQTLAVKGGRIDCCESGSTLRFLIPVAAVSGEEFTFTGKGRLPQRPIGPYLECLPKAGVQCQAGTGLPLTIKGALKSGNFSLPGDISSQFITGLLFALPLLCGDSRIFLTSPLESADYITLTIAVMRRFGIKIEPRSDGYFIPGGQTYNPLDINAEGDWSQAAFWLTAGAVGDPVKCLGLDCESYQGDRKIVHLLRGFGADVLTDDGVITARKRQLNGMGIDAAQIPDLVPILAVAACFCDGRTVIRNAARLRIKESDRLWAICSGLKSFGARISELEDGLVIEAGRPLHGGIADGCNDHRIVMALSIAACFCTHPCTIHGCDCINKSYPAFYEDFYKLGGHADVIRLG